MRGEPALQLPPLHGQPADRIEFPRVAAECIEQRQLLRSRQQRLVLVLAMDLHQHFTEFAELREGGRAAVDPRARTAVGADHPAQQAGARIVGIVEFVVAQPVGGNRRIVEREFGSKLGHKPLRFVHIDSHHSRDCLTNDLELVHRLLHAQAIVCLDDMLHPGYPMMACAAFDYLKRHPEMRLLSVVDREDIVAAPKFLLCRGEALKTYQDDMMAAFARFHFTLGADMESYLALVLTPHPQLAEVV